MDPQPVSHNPDRIYETQPHDAPGRCEPGIGSVRRADPLPESRLSVSGPAAGKYRRHRAADLPSDGYWHGAAGPAVQRHLPAPVPQRICAAGAAAGFCRAEWNHGYLCGGPDFVPGFLRRRSAGRPGQSTGICGRGTGPDHLQGHFTGDGESVAVAGGYGTGPDQLPPAQLRQRFADCGGAGRAGACPGEIGAAGVCRAGGSARGYRTGAAAAAAAGRGLREYGAGAAQKAIGKKECKAGSDAAPAAGRDAQGCRAGADVAPGVIGGAKKRFRLVPVAPGGGILRIGRGARGEIPEGFR